MINSSFITGQLNAYGIPLYGSSTWDFDYVVPTAEWVSKTYAAALTSNLNALGLMKWASEAWDCDDFAKLAWAMAAVCHARTKGRLRAALAFGAFIYLDTPGNPKSKHAINLFFDEELRLRFFEPQSQTIKTLTSDQMISCEKWLI
mgnify:CR=1 FL=1